MKTSKRDFFAMEKRFLLSALLVQLLLSGALSKVNIWEPKSLKAIYSHTKFEYSVMDFGSVPYGHSVYGTVFKSTPYDACTDLTPISWDANYGTLIIMANRGGCTFATKVINAQKIGAGLVMIADNTVEDVHRIFPIERTKEQLDKVNIPSVLVSKQESEDILKALEAPVNKPHDKASSQVELAVHFELTKSYGKTKFKMIVAVDDYRSYDQILNFDKYFQTFSKYLDYMIHFKLFYNSSKFFEPEDCIGPKEDHYCTGKSFGNTKKDLKLPHESLKQLCLKNYNYKQYIKYLVEVRNKCFGSDKLVVDDFAACTENSFVSVIDSSTRSTLKNCMDPQHVQAHEALSTNHDNIKYYLINYSPIIFINGSYYKGNYDDESHLMESICNTFEEPPAECNYLSMFQQSFNLNTYHLNRFIFFSLSTCIWIVILAVIIFYLLYKKRIQTAFEYQLNDRINEALAKFKEAEDAEVGDTESEKEDLKGEDESTGELPEDENDIKQELTTAD